MNKSAPESLNSSRKLLLSVAALMAVAVPIVFGQVNATQNQAQSPQTASASLPSFEVASIKPNKSGSNIRSSQRFLPDGFRATRITLQMLIRDAYGLFQDNQISGAPNWVKSEEYDVDTKADESVANELLKLSLGQRLLVERRMLQPILEDRFQLKFHHETKELPVYWLVVAKAGKLHEAEGDCGSNDNLIPPLSEPSNPHPTPCGGFFWGGSQIRGQKVPLTQLVNILSRFFTKRVVLDKTGLTGNYDIELNWTPEQDPLSVAPADGQSGMPLAPQAASNGPSLFTAIEEQLGLKLESKKGPVEVIVIDHVERPSEN